MHYRYRKLIIEKTWLIIAAALVCHGGCGRVLANDRVTIHHVDGRQVTGQLQSLDSNRAVLQGAATKPTPIQEIYFLEFEDHSVRQSSGRVVTYLANGDRLYARPQSINEVLVAAQWESLDDRSPLSIPLETVAAVFLDDTATDRSQSGREPLGRSENQRSDVVVLENSDRLSGEIIQWKDRQLSIETPAGALSIPVDQIATVLFNPELVSFPAVEGRYAIMTLTDGSVLHIRDYATDGEAGLSFQAVFGAKMNVPLSVIRSLTLIGGDATFLSDLENEDYEFTPYLSGDWKLERDRSVAGKPLTLRGNSFVKGLGMHSRCRVTYQLRGDYRLFHAIVGIDDAAQGMGNATFAVEGDGRPLATLGSVTGRADAQRLGPLDITGVDRLTLIVDFGEFGDIQDHANWCHALVVR